MIYIYDTPSVDILIKRDDNNKHLLFMASTPSNSNQIYLYLICLILAKYKLKAETANCTITIF